MSPFIAGNQLSHKRPWSDAAFLVHSKQIAMSKYLLITADDFGMCHSINRGIVRAMTEGVVSSTNLLVPCPWFHEALSLAKRHQLPAGVHLCLTCDWDHLKWGPLTRAESLVDERGHFFGSYAELGRQAKEADIYAELKAQIERVKGLGRAPTHLDNHMLGTFEGSDIAELVRTMTLRLCSEYDLIYTYHIQGDRLVHFMREIVLSSRPHADTFKMLETCTEPGAYHLIGHAAEASSELEAMCSVGWHSRSWAASWRVADQEFFTHPNTVQKINDLGFEIIGVRKLQEL
jgi:hypothetical protein